MALMTATVGPGVGPGMGLIFRIDDCQPGVEATCLITGGRVVLALIIAGVAGLVGCIAAARITSGKWPGTCRL